MTRGFKSPGYQAPLPKVSFVLVQGDDSAQLAGVHDQQARSYGYNDFSEFQKPDHYIRYIAEPLEKDLAIQVEYDMDEQDQEWLDAINVERKKDQINLVTYETFEIIMDRLEKEYFDLTKNIPKSDYAMPSEDSTCAICDDSEGENSNAIVFCDGCNLAVHQVQDCYGVPYIPEGQWLCRKCTVSPENPVSCIFCPNEGGAFKQTTLGDWAHLLCAIWIPETRVANEVFMEPITGSDKIPKQRWKLKCSVCGVREGACIQCTKTSCFLAFHTTCARKEKLLMPMKSTQGSEPVTLTCYCEKHLPKEQAEARLKALALDSVISSPSSKLSKSARAYAKTYKTGPPLVPQIIVDRIINYITKINIRKKPEFVHMACKYWSLKREARRGAPLLKRLHLEPWTASNAGKLLSEEEKTLKLEHLKHVRRDLEMLHELALLSRKRESRKLAQAEAIQKVLDTALFPHLAPMRLAFEKVLALDRNGLFKHPVSRTEVPDYYEVVKNPMTWDAIDVKLDRHEYWDFESFKAKLGDVELVLSNAILYNKPGTAFYKTAQRMQTTVQRIFEELVSLRHQQHPQPDDAQGSIGDFELPLDALRLLVSQEQIQDAVNLILETDPLTSLFDYELGRIKPPPPPPPPKPKPGKKKSTKVSKAVEPSALDAAPGFRAPRTRRALAAAAAFEAEAAGSVVEEVQEVQEAGAGDATKKPTKLRTPGQPELVEDVDSQGSFKMFDAGWILPTGQKRGGRQAVERPLLPPPKKRMRTGACRENLPFAEMDVPMDVKQQREEGPPTALPIPALEPVPEPISEPVPETVPETVPIPETVPVPIAELVPETVLFPKPSLIIIEELDTPATRREKASRRKAEKKKAAAAATAAAHSQAQHSRDKGNGHESDLSSLSDLESEEDGGREVGPKERQPFVQPVSNTTQTLTLLSDTYPWWPAVVYEPDDERIPPAVKKQRDVGRRIGDGPVHLIQFFDKASQWQWMGASRLLLLGEDNALDAEMVAATSRRQRWKTASIRKDCRDAYARAIAEMETEADIVVEPDVIETGGEGIVAEHGAMATDPEVGLGNAAGEPQSDAMETADPSTTAEAGSGGAELAAPAG
ncbi:PHD-zinc-finger like domain-containing protein [Boletus coccyginus]|nr:PHD-zinc-finger like domain-containing protein [Boletus coccyginus]